MNPTLALRQTVGGLSAALVLATAAPAQTIRVVDPTAGPYRTPAAAVAAASPGDTILFRNGGMWVQLDVTIPLHFVAEPPAPVLVMLNLQFATRPDRPVTVTGINTFWLWITRGDHVVLEDVFAGWLRVQDTTSLRVVGSRLNANTGEPGTHLSNTNAVIVDSTLTGLTGRCWDSAPQHATPAIVIEDSILLLAGCAVAGGNGATLSCGTAAPAPAITGQRANVTVTDSTVTGGTGAPLVAVALDSASALLLDPSVAVQGSTTPPPTRAVHTALHGTGTMSGQPASVRLLAPPQTLAFVAVADTASGPTNTPLGSLWFDPNRYVVTVWSAVVDGSGAATFGYTMPPLQRGAALHFQGLALPPSDPPALTMPLPVTVQ